MKRLFTLIIVSICLFLVIFSYFGPWFSVYKEEKETEIKMDFYINNHKVDIKSPQINTEYTDEYEDSPELTPFEVLRILVIIAIIIAAINLIFTLGASFNFGYRLINMRVLAVLFNIIVLILFFVIAIYFFSKYKEALAPFYSGTLEFWFSTSYYGYEYSFGPGISWYVMIIGGFLSLLPTIILIKYPFEKNKLESSSTIQSSIDKTNNPNYYPCPNCGRKISLGSSECPFCGTRFRNI